jgi:cytoskeleton protein RodZ
MGMAADMTEAGTHPGGHLRGIREQRGLSLHQVAVELHVSDSLIQALESGDYAALGGAVFVRGHLRNYARALGVAENEVLSLYEQGQNKPSAPGLVTQHSHVGGVSPKMREWYMRAATGGVVLVLLVLAMSWWQHRPEEPVATAPANQVQSAPLPAPAATSAVAGVPLPALSAPANPPPAQQQAERLSTPLAPTPVKPAPVQRVQHEEHKPAASAVAAPAAAAPQAAGGLTQVKFTLSSASWIEVYDDSGKRIYYDLAPAGGSLDLSGIGPLQVFLGNAPGVSVELNGTAFDIKAYSRADNTARFKLGTAGGKGN